MSNSIAEWLHERREKSGCNETLAFLDPMKLKGKQWDAAFDLYSWSKGWHCLNKEQAEAHFNAAVERHGSVKKALEALKQEMGLVPKMVRVPKSEQMTARKFLEQIESKST